MPSPVRYNAAYHWSKGASSKALIFHMLNLNLQKSKFNNQFSVKRYH